MEYMNDMLSCIGAWILSIDPMIRAAWVGFFAVLLGAGAALKGSRNVLRSTNDRIEAERKLADRQIEAERSKEMDRIKQEEPVAASMLFEHLAVFMAICFQMMQKTVFYKAIEDGKFPKFEEYNDKLPWKSLDLDIMIKARSIRARLICISLNMSMHKDYISQIEQFERDFRDDFRETGKRCIELIREVRNKHLPNENIHPIDEKDLRIFEDDFSAPLPEGENQ